MTGKVMAGSMEEVRHRWEGGAQGFVAGGVAESTKGQAKEGTPTPKAAFIKGPLSLAWVRAAALLPGKTLHVGLYLWYLAGLTQSRTVVLSGRVAELGVSREAKAEALLRLEAAGLVSVVRRPGCAPLVTLVVGQERI